MKIPIDDYACIDPDAPTLPAYEAFVSGSVYWLAWCDHCGKYHHHHGPAEGHRIAHCNDPASPFYKTGYNLAYAGKLADHGSSRIWFRSVN